MADHLMHPKLSIQLFMHLLGGQRNPIDRRTPVASDQLTAWIQRSQRLLDNLRQVRSAQVVTQLVQHDQVERLRRPAPWQRTLVHVGIGDALQPRTGQIHGALVHVITEQVTAARREGQAGFASGAARFENGAVMLPGQAGQQQGALAPLIPAAAHGPRVVIVQVQRVEIIVVDA